MVKRFTYFFNIILRRFRDSRYNMHTDADETFFKRLYLHYLQSFFDSSQTILEIGCQYGRFTIDLLKDGKKVVATDIDRKFGRYIHNKTQSNRFTFLKEDIFTTLNNPPTTKFDAVICLEVLQFVPALDELIQKSKPILAPKGTLIFTIRPTAFFLEKFVSLGNFEIAGKIQNSDWNKHQCLSPESALLKLESNGWKLELMAGIGIFSGRREDRKSPLCSPKRLSRAQLERLFQLETDPVNQAWGLHKSRYLLIVATPVNQI